jgi:hypothetical protein
MLPKIITFAGATELFSVLQNTEIGVPLRTEGRKTQHTEMWTICRLLATLGKNDQILFPVSLEHRDRPDFLVTAGSWRIGVEITEAVSQEYAAYCAIAEREFPNAILQPSYFRWGAPKMTLEEMRQALRQTQILSEPWVGDRPEQEWALFMQSVLTAKLEKLAKPQFSKFDENWLAIYDNLPLPNVDLGKAINHLRPLLEDCWGKSASFSSVFIEHGSIIVQVTPNGSKDLVLHNLWR